MSKAVILAVDHQTLGRRRLREELKKRYGADYTVLTAASAAAALRRMEQLRRFATPLALVLAAWDLPGLAGAELCRQVRPLHPHARRVLVSDFADQSAEPAMLQATAQGAIEAHVLRPLAPPDEEFHGVVTDLLRAWAHETRPLPEVVRVVGERLSPRAHELRDLLQRNSVPYGFYEAASAEGQALLEALPPGERVLPVIVMLDGRAFPNPSNVEVAQALNVNVPVETLTEGGREPLDLVVVGAGPAGLSAAVYAASEGLRTLVIEREAMGGQAGTSAHIRNYLGFPMGISGSELAQRAYSQAWLFQANFLWGNPAVDLRVDGDLRSVVLADGTELRTRTVLLAVGVTYRRLGITSLEGLVGAGVYYGAAMSEAGAMSGQDTIVVGGGNSAGQAAVHLARYARRVTMLVRGPTLAASMSEYLIDRIAQEPKIEVRHHQRVVDGGGSGRLERVVVENTQSGQVENLAAAGMFVFIGARPHTDWLPLSLHRDHLGYLVTGLNQRGEPPSGWPLARPPLLLETSLPRVFAAGDVRQGAVKRVASAVGEGALAVHFIHQSLAV